MNGEGKRVAGVCRGIRGIKGYYIVGTEGYKGRY